MYYLRPVGPQAITLFFQVSGHPNTHSDLRQSIHPVRPHVIHSSCQASDLRPFICPARSQVIPLFRQASVRHLTIHSPYQYQTSDHSFALLGLSSFLRSVRSQVIPSPSQAAGLMPFLHPLRLGSFLCSVMQVSCHSFTLPGLRKAVHPNSLIILLKLIIV